MEVDDAIELWQETIQSIKMHIYRKRRQVHAYNEDKSSLKEGEILLHVNFSESYKNKEQNEIQAAYFGQHCFSIFNVCVYFLDKNKVRQKYLLTIITESSKHNCNTAFICVSKSVHHIREKIQVLLNSVIVSSDRCGSQFHSK